MDIRSLIQKIDLDTPFGVQFTNRIISLMSLNLDYSEGHGINLKISFDAEEVQNALSQFLEDSFKSETFELDTELLKAISVNSNLISYRPISDNEFGLTPKEIQIMEEVSQGKSDKEIQDTLNMKYYTIKSHLKKIFV